MTPTTIQCGRRGAVIDGRHVQLTIIENKRRGVRPVRGGERTLISEADCWFAALMWARKHCIDFGDREPQQH